MDGLSRIFYVTLIAACFYASVKGNIFGKGKETIFSYNADVRAGTVDPEHYASQFGLSGTLNVQSSKDGSSALFQFSNISFQVYNGPLSYDEHPEAQFLPASPESSPLEQPFEVIYRGGLVKSIITNENDEEWSTNMKKSIAGILQLDMDKLHFDKNYSFSSEEKTIYGNCTSEYSVISKQEGNAIVRKMSLHSRCKRPNAFHYWSNLVGIPCTIDYQRSVDEGNERLFELHSSAENLLLNKVLTQGIFSFSPYSEGFSQYIKVKQTFKLEKQGPSDKYQLHPGKTESEPRITLIRFDEKSGTRLSLTGGRSIPTKETLIPSVHKQLQDLVDVLEEVRVGGPNDQDGFLEQKSKEHSHLLSFHLIRILGFLDYESLKNCYSVIGVGTSYKEETVRDLFLDLLSQVGTKASISLLQDLIVNHRLKTESAIQILKNIPFYARQPNEDLLQTYESILEIQDHDQVKRAATLSFATLINRACQFNICSPEVIDKYVLQYFKLFKDSTEYQWQLNYLEGLSNIEIGNVVEYLEPIIKGDQPYSHHIRFLAMWAARLNTIRNPQKVLEIYLPILEDKSQHLELRIGALTILLLSKPLPDRFHSLAALMAEEPEGSHLYYFFYSTLQSLVGTKHPCYMEMKKSAQHILQYAKKPRKEPMWTGNHMFDYADNVNSYGSLLQVFMVADQRTGGPNVLYFLQNEHFLGHSWNLLSFYVKMQGIRKSIKEKIMKFDQDEDKIAKLQLLLSSLGVNQIVEKDETVHVELIVQFQDKAIMTHYYNETSLAEMFETLKAMGSGIQSDFNINYQRILFPIINELTGPTDLGVPMSLTVPIPFIFSLRGNFTHDIMGSKITRKNQIDIKYWRHGGAFLTVYNPVGNLWHGVSRLHSALVHIPINTHVSVDVAHRNLKFAVSRSDDSVPGIAIHTGSNVFAIPGLTLENDIHKTLIASCPSCLSQHPVKGKNYHDILEYTNEEHENLGMNYIFRYFDCDVSDIPFLIDNAFESAFDDASMNYGERYPVLGLGILVILRFYNDMTYFPISGRCGMISKITPTAESYITKVVGVVHFMSEDSNSKENGKVASPYQHKDKYLIRGSLSQELSAGNAVQLYDFTINYQVSLGDLHHSLKVKFTMNDPSNEKLKMCLDGELHYPEPPLDPFKQRDPEKEEVNGSISVIVGLTSYNKCPKRGVVFKMIGRASPIPDRNKISYETCREEGHLEEWVPEISSLTPSTHACFVAALDSTVLRRFEFSGEMPEDFQDLSSKFMDAMVTDGIYPWGGYIISSNYSTDEYPIIKDGKGFVVEFPSNEIILLDTIGEEERERNVFNSYIPSLPSSRFPVSIVTAHDRNILGYCVVTATSVLALDDSYLSYQAPTCYTLAFGHCYTSNPTFAVLVRKIEGTKKLALKVYNLENYIEIIPGPEHSIEVNVNGQHVYFDKENGYEYVQNDISIFRMWQKFSKTEKPSTLYLSLYITPIKVKLHYTGGRVIAHVPSLFSGEICGLCGDFNRQPSIAKWETCKH